ncbi:MAG: hypothetical protein JSR93_10575 [Verrucomicrobia bacterium]|nr:hypothetical protein [Verrucomicrobiota bacterium]
MADPNLPSDISSTDRIGALQAISEGEEKSSVSSQSFASFMQGEKASPMATAGKTPLISPFELAQGQTPLAQAPTIDSLMAQINSAQGTVNDMQNNLNYPNLKLKSSNKYLMKNKLVDANTNLRAANAKMGAEVPAEPDATKFSGPLGKFLSLLGDGQAQLQSAQKQLQDLKDKGTNITPGDFLLIQVKISKATQELEYSSVLLSTAVQDFKTMMQIQL